MIPLGNVERVSPIETCHSLIVRISDDIAKGLGDAWKRVLLSCPVILEDYAHPDAKFARTNSIRSEQSSVARATRYSARQTIYNIMAFKARKESGGQKYSAEAISKFWDEHVTKGAGDEALYKKGTIDACITIYERLLSIPQCEQLIHKNDELKGPDSAWNSIWKLQEVVSRGKTTKWIREIMEGLSQQLDDKKISDKDITIVSLKSGTAKSLTDPLLQQAKLRVFLLGDWLDGKSFPSFVKAKVRELFVNHASYNSLWKDCVNTTWLLGWPKVGKQLINFLENSCYSSSQGEDYTL